MWKESSIKSYKEQEERRQGEVQSQAAFALRQKLLDVLGLPALVTGDTYILDGVKFRLDPRERLCVIREHGILGKIFCCQSKAWHPVASWEDVGRALTEPWECLSSGYF